MKCDELEAYGMNDPAIGDEYEMYKVSDVDDAIAELKAENERLNRELEHVKNGDCINTCDVVEKHVKEEIKAKRALWLLKAKYFWILMVYASELSKVANPSIIQKSNFFENPTARCMEEYQHEAELYDNARIKCIKKAEEYK